MRKYFFDDYGPRLWVFIAVPAVIVVGGGGLMIHSSTVEADRRFRERFDECMRDKTDKYFCDDWARGQRRCR